MLEEDGKVTCDVGSQPPGLEMLSKPGQSIGDAAVLHAPAPEAEPGHSGWPMATLHLITGEWDTGEAGDGVCEGFINRMRVCSMFLADVGVLRHTGFHPAPRSSHQPEPHRT